MAAAPDRFETIAWVYDQGELAILLSLFAHEDIWVVPIGRGHISVQWGWTVALGGVAIRVHAEDGQAARALLASIERTPRQRTRIFVKDRLVDVLLLLVLFYLATFVPPARIQAEFVAARREEAV